MKPTRVLFIMGSMEIGGVQSGIMNFAKITPSNEVIFDVAVHNGEIGFHEAEFGKYGNVYHLPVLVGKTKLTKLVLTFINDWLFKRKLIRFLRSHPGYDAVHSKSLNYSAAAVEAAEKCGIPVRIAQSHVDKPDRMNTITAMQYKWQAKRIEKAATHKLAVSNRAAELMFGKYGGTVIKNPTISLKRLDPTMYHPASHDGINLVQIGTYSRRKNQIFSLKVLKEILNKGINAKLTFVGFPLDEPEYIEDVKKETEKSGISDRVCFLSKDSDIPKLLSESDYMLIPSLREGLPNVALEAQAMGVPCFISDSVDKNTDCGLCTFLSLDKGAQYWAQQLVLYREKNGTDKKYIDMSDWDNENVVQEYIKIWKNEV